MGLDEEISSPFDSSKKIICLARVDVTFGVGDTSPGQDGHCVGHRKPEFDVVTGCKWSIKFIIDNVLDNNMVERVHPSCATLEFLQVFQFTNTLST